MSQSVKVPASDDMRDPFGEAAELPLLSRFLHEFGPVVEAFHAAEERAFIFQRQYRKDVEAVKWTGLIAVLLAILILFLHDEPYQWPFLGNLVLVAACTEAIAGAIALLVVFFGNARSHKNRWLLERNRAERCRMLKFRTMVDPEIWYGQETVQVRQLVEWRLRDIQNADLPELWVWVDKDPAPESSAPSGAGTAFSTEALHQLVSYYRRVRLGFQRNYLDKTARKLEEEHRSLPSTLSFFFFASIVCVFVHVLLDFVGKLAGEPHSLMFSSLACLCLAVALPAVAAGLRTGHLANETARNASRYRAKSNALGVIDERLARALSAEDPQAVLRELASCEYVLDLDQREWLRLMTFAEWY